MNKFKNPPNQSVVVEIANTSIDRQGLAGKFSYMDCVDMT